VWDGGRLTPAALFGYATAMEWQQTAESGADEILRGLNPVQREAVVFGDGALLILAGAGSGKTRVLTRRIAHLILHRGIASDRILAVTFTNKAAGEMRERVSGLLGFDVKGLWIGTFHAICLRLIRRHSARLGFPGQVTVFDADDQAAILKEILKEEQSAPAHRAAAGDASDTLKVRQLQSIISLAKNKLWSPADLEANWPRPERSTLAHLYQRYQEKLRAQQGVDFDDILVLAVRLLEEDPELGDAYANRFRHILVDEYQDTNHVQFRLIRRLAQAHGNILVVGDDDQSIYGWRGADLGNILDFEEHFPRAHVLRMTQNYRSTSAICELANAVVSRNVRRREKSLWTEREGGIRPEFFLAENEEEEARRVLRSIERMRRERGLRYGQVAILYRVHAQSRPFEEACLQSAIPYALVGGTLFYQRREVKDLVAYVRLAANHLDGVSFARALNVPPRGLGAVSEAGLLRAAERLGGNLVEACLAPEAAAGLRGKALQSARAFGSLLRDLAARLDEGPAALLRHVVEQTRYLEWLKQSGDRDAEERAANVLELMEGAGRFQEEHPEATLADWLDQVALYTNLDTQAMDADRLTLMTVHNAKGLEFPHVHITGCEEGLFPHSSAYDNESEMEEERRLFYVAATRAMDTLTLSASRDRWRVNRMGGGLSRFIHELPDGLLLDVSGGGVAAAWAGELRAAGFAEGRGQDDAMFARRAPSGERPRGGASAGHRPPHEPAPAVRAARWKGRQVEHAIFGTGRVEQEDGTGGEARLTILFPQAGRRKVLARFVKAV